MQNNVIELTQRLLRSLDNNYNVVDMPAVVEIISILEKVTITKEILETTRLGRFINELRKKTSNESLSKRAKELVKKWKNMLLPDQNGQSKQPYQGQISERTDSEKNRKRPGRDIPEQSPQTKRPKLNGQSTLFDFSDNSNSSFKDVNHTNRSNELRTNSSVIMINSDSNSSLPDTLRQDPPVEQQLPKKRGRKRGSKNHRNLLDDAESSLANKLAVSRSQITEPSKMLSSLCMSRGNSKVKTTQELIAGLQSKGASSILNLPPLNSRPKEDLNERAAKLTERVSMIDQRLYTNSNRSKQKNRFTAKMNVPAEKNERVIESGSVINDKSLSGVVNKDDDEEIIVVDDVAVNDKKDTPEEPEVASREPEGPPPLTVEEILAQLPPIDYSVLDQPEEEEPPCTCVLKTDFSIEEGPEGTEVQAPCTYEFVEDSNCPAKAHLAEKYRVGVADEESVSRLGLDCLPNVNGNIVSSKNDAVEDKDENGLYFNVVPNVYSECKLKGELPKENYKRYSISEGGPEPPEGERTGGSEVPGFAEWHECIDRPSYNGENLRILPYVVID